MDTVAAMTTIWETRDLPVLRAIVELTEEGSDYVEPHAIASRTGLDGDQVQRALRSLSGEDPPFFSVTENPSLGGGPSFFDVHNPTGHARRTVGSWPTPQSLAESIVAAFQEAADNEADEAKKGKLRRVAESVREAGTGVVVGVLANVISGQIG